MIKLPPTVELSLLSHTDPVRLVELLTTRPGRHRVTRLWTSVAALLIIVVGTFSAAMTGDPRQFVGRLLVILVLGWNGAAVGLALTSKVRFWLCYSVSPVMLTLAALPAIATLPPWELLACLLPYTLGMSLAVTSILWIYDNEYWRQRLEVPPYSRNRSTLGARLRDWRRVAWIRWGFVATMFIGAIVALFVPLIDNIPGRDVALIAVCLALGFARLDATLAVLAGYPLVTISQGQATTTFAGRFGLTTSSSTMSRFLPPYVPVETSVQLWMTLLAEGIVGQYASTTIARLESPTLQQFLSIVSLQPDGADALLCLTKQLPVPLRTGASGYTRLAQEAQVAPALQQWVTAIEVAMPLLQITEPKLVRALDSAQRALLSTHWTELPQDVTTSLRAWGAQWELLTMTPSTPNWYLDLIMRLELHSSTLFLRRHDSKSMTSNVSCS